MTILDSIRARLQAAATEDGRSAVQKFVPSAGPCYGVRVPVLNQLASELKGADFETVETLWSSGIYEERLLAAKLIGRLAKKQPREAWETIQHFTPDISDWPTCDTLATESVRPTLELLSDEIAESASNYVEDDREWIRRFGLVLLTNFC